MARHHLISLNYRTEKRNYAVIPPPIFVGRGSSPRPILGPVSPGYAIFFIFRLGAGGWFPLILNPLDLRIELPSNYGRLGREGVLGNAAGEYPTQLRLRARCDATRGRSHVFPRMF